MRHAVQTPAKRRRAAELVLNPVWLIGVCALGLSACSQEPTQPSARALAMEIAVSQDPPGAALPLSIGGRLLPQDGDGQDAAVRCAAALSLTAQRLARLTENPLQSEIALMRRAQEFFRLRAEQAAIEAGAKAGSIQPAVARRREEKRDDVTGQAQLAIACLRRFGNTAGNAVELQAGEAL